MLSVHELRTQGYKVKVFHNRLVDDQTGEILCRGGSTVIELTTPDNVTYTHTAKCNEKDNYNKKRGVQIALGRILKGIRNANN